MGDDDLMLDLASASSWDVATRYHEFKTASFVKKNQKLSDHLRALSVSAVLERARAVLGSVVHPVDHRVGTLNDIPYFATQAELDLDETFENSPLSVIPGDHPGSTPSADDIWMSFQVPRRQAIVLCVDTSLSMTGEKLALTAVALAVVLLQFPEDPIGIIAFENLARVLKMPHEPISIAQLLERFLDVPAQGYTHLEGGMKAALKMIRGGDLKGHQSPPSLVLLTDGKYTAGKDPAYLASRFPHVILLKMGDERASRDLCVEIARRGHGALREVPELEALPQAMYAVVKDLLRGH